MGTYFMSSKIRRLLMFIPSNIVKWINMFRCRGKTKYFCIGRNKTGTSSLKKAFEDLGFITGNQREAEILYDKYYFNNEFDPVIDYCKTAQVFQDAPFSCPDTFKYLDKAYPGSKFILTVRDDAEQWYQSLIKFHIKLFGEGERIPTSEDLKNAEYVRKGFMYNMLKLYNTSDSDPYNKDILIAHYEKHNQEILNYFKDRPDDLLVLNVSKADDYKRFVKFIGVESPFSQFPWENKTSNFSITLLFQPILLFSDYYFPFI